MVTKGALMRSLLQHFKIIRNSVRVEGKTLGKHYGTADAVECTKISGNQDSILVCLCFRSHKGGNV